MAFVCFTLDVLSARFSGTVKRSLEKDFYYSKQKPHNAGNKVTSHVDNLLAHAVIQPCFKYT